MSMTAKERKEHPVFSGVLMYFPDAILEVAKTSWVGNEQHHPGEPLHWDRSKSTDELDALTRHLIQAGTVDSDGIRHSAKVAWRALANLQKEIENEKIASDLKTPLDRVFSAAGISSTVGTDLINKEYFDTNDNLINYSHGTYSGMNASSPSKDYGIVTSK
jgi:hypothetical protein